MPKISKRKDAPPPLTTLPYGKWVAASDIAGPHPSVPFVYGSNVDYFDDTIEGLTKSGIDLLLQTHPIGVADKKHAGDKYFVVTGLRTWQLYQSYQLRNLIKSSAIPVVLLPDCIDDESIRKISSIDFHLSFYLYSTAPEKFADLLVRIERLIDDAAWKEIYGLRPMRTLRGPATFKKSSGEMTPLKRPPSPQLDSNGNPVKRPRGRPPKSSSPPPPTPDAKNVSFNDGEA